MSGSGSNKNKKIQVTQIELAQILGITSRRVRDLVNDNDMFSANMKKGRYIYYDLAVCVKEYIDYKLELETSAGNNPDYWKEKAEHERLKKKMTELKLKRAKRESFDEADVLEAWAGLILVFKAQVLALPQKLAPLLLGIDDLAEISQIIDGEVNSTLEVLSEFDLSMISDTDFDIDDNDDEKEETVINDKPSAAKQSNKNRRKPTKTTKKADGKSMGGRKTKNQTGN